MKHLLKSILAASALVLATFCAGAAERWAGGLMTTGTVTYVNFTTNAVFPELTQGVTLRDYANGVTIVANMGGAVTNVQLRFAVRLDQGTVESDWTTGGYLIFNVPSAGVWHTNFPASAIGNANRIKFVEVASTSAVDSIYLTNAYWGQFFTE